MSVHGLTGRAAKVVALAKSQQGKLRMHVHPDKLTAARKEALGAALLDKLTAVNCVLDAALPAHLGRRQGGGRLPRLPSPHPRTSTAGCAAGAVVVITDTKTGHRHCLDVTFTDPSA